MQAASRHALGEVRATSAQAIGSGGGVTALSSLAAELYSVAALLVAQPRLRRTLADPATDPQRRAELARSLFGSQVREATGTILRTAASQRWSSAWDFADSLEIAGDDALFAAAESDGALDRVEDQLFRLERILAANGDVVGLLDEQAVTAERRIALLDDLIGGKVSPITRDLLHHAVSSSRKRSILLAIDDLLEEAARRRERSLAKVLSATPLTGPQVDKLADVLTDVYHRPITVRADVDPKLRGGLYIRVGDEVIDGTVAHRLSQLRGVFSV